MRASHVFVAVYFFLFSSTVFASEAGANNVSLAVRFSQNFQLTIFFCKKSPPLIIEMIYFCLLRDNIYSRPVFPEALLIDPTVIISAR